MNKYRVWCKNKDEWETHQCFLSPSGGLFDYQNGRLNPLKDETHIVQFFTGLLDKDQKEIYEGDIVKVPMSDEDRITECQWWHNSAGFNLLAVDGKSYGVWAVGFTFNSECRQEVIGNIYENPELLNHNIQV